VRTQSEEFAEEKGRQRLRPLAFEILPSLGRRSAEAQEGAQQPSDRMEKEIWTVGFYVQEAAGEVHRRGRS
jgi:hypothetical protein